MLEKPPSESTTHRIRSPSSKGEIDEHGETRKWNAVRLNREADCATPDRLAKGVRPMGEAICFD
jgi:hypothetical protein